MHEGGASSVPDLRICVPMCAPAGPWNANMRAATSFLPWACMHAANMQLDIAPPHLHHRILLTLLHRADLVSERGALIILLPCVPVHVLVLLPSPGQRLHAVPQVVTGVLVGLDIFPRKLRAARSGSWRNPPSSACRAHSFVAPPLTWSLPPRVPPRGGPL